MGGLPGVPLQLAAGSGSWRQAQLDDKDDLRPKLDRHRPVQVRELEGQRPVAHGHGNPNYWQKAPDGKPYPYLDKIAFRPIPDGAQRLNALESGDVNIMHTSSAEDIGGTLNELREDGKLNMLRVREVQAEVVVRDAQRVEAAVRRPPMRQALAMGVDRKESTRSQQRPAHRRRRSVRPGLHRLPRGHRASRSTTSTRPRSWSTSTCRAAARPEFTLSTTTDPETVRLAELIQQRAKKVGVKVKIKPADQAALINDAIGGKFQAMTLAQPPRRRPRHPVRVVVRATPTRANPVNFGGSTTR